MVSLLLKDLALLAGRLFDLEQSGKSTVELEDHGDKAKAKNSFGVIMQILILDIVFFGLGHHCRRLADNKWVIIIAVLLSFSSSCFSMP